MPHRPPRSFSRTKRVLILGGGFGGIGAARKLHDSDARVTLVDANDYHRRRPAWITDSDTGDVLPQPPPEQTSGKTNKEARL